MARRNRSSNNNDNDGVYNSAKDNNNKDLINIITDAYKVCLEFYHELL